MGSFSQRLGVSAVRSQITRFLGNHETYSTFIRTLPTSTVFLSFTKLDACVRIVMASSTSSLEPLEPDSLQQLQLFRRQYLQLQDIQSLTWPSSDYLRRANVQKWIYEQCFQTVDSSVLPPERYQLRILKPLLARIENAIVDPEEDVSVYRFAIGISDSCSAQCLSYSVPF